MNGRELTEANRPEGRVFEWFFEPMTIVKEQLRALQLQESEELYLYQLVLNAGDSKCTKTWDNGGIPPSDEIRRAELQALARRYFQCHVSFEFSNHYFTCCNEFLLSGISL